MQPLNNQANPECIWGLLAQLTWINPDFGHTIIAPEQRVRTRAILGYGEILSCPRVCWMVIWWTILILKVMTDYNSILAWTFSSNLTNIKMCTFIFGFPWFQISFKWLVLNASKQLVLKKILSPEILPFITIQISYFCFKFMK